MTQDPSLTEPVREPASPAEAGHAGLLDGTALCLSGGGFRAMLFHAGAIRRLNEFGLLGRLSRVSSVSGGSITAGVLALHWPGLQWEGDPVRVRRESLEAEFIEPLRELARHTIDIPAIGWGMLNPFKSISDEVIAAYDKHLFEKKTLQDLADETEDADRKDKTKPWAPRFVFTATNVKTGSLWRFAKPYMADYRVGMVEKPDVPLAVAVAASSAFPPFLSPLRMNLDPFTFLDGIPEGIVARSLRAEAVLTDGGVYDNLGLEPVWKRYKTVLVSDGGHPSDDDLRPADDWARHSRRLIDLLQREVGALRIRQIMNAFTTDADPHHGTYWGIGTDAARYPAAGALECPVAQTAAIAHIDTRLAALSEADQERIMNWGYAVCDRAVRSYLADFKQAKAAEQFPYPQTGLGN
jgi:NTE family protein